ncbi:uncharacterized protein C10orf105 homolog [Lathamus discolor]|uniref:uncharacterized protein C10orf105 homolog n=1 Tax=Lathamus discolor TaxID=678569 RepID=UPI0032B7940C
MHPGCSTPRASGAQPQGTAALAKPGRGLSAPLGFAHSGCSQPGCQLSPTLPCPAKGRRGLAAAERGGRGGKAGVRELGQPVRGKMSTEDTGNGTSPTTPLLGLLVSATELVPPSYASPETADPLLVIVALICIFLLLATFLIFVTLCKPAALDQARSGPHECMPHHPVDASEPQLRFWKRLGSLRCSINTFRRSQPMSQRQLTCPRSSLAGQNWNIMESTKM